MKRFIIIGAIFLMISNIVCAVEDINKTSINEKIEVRMPQLSDVKLNKLMEYIGIPVPDGFFGCLCGPGRVAGGGCKYAPGHDCWCGGPLGGGGFVGFMERAYERCIKSKKYDDGTTIVDVLSSEIIPLQEKIAGDTATLARFKEYEEKLLLNNLKYKSLCLPVFPKGYEEVIFDGWDWNTFITAGEIAEKAENICEEAIAVNLFINSKQSASNLRYAWKTLGIWVLPNEYDIAGFADDKLLALGIIKTSLGKAFTAASLLTNMYNQGELSNEEEKKAIMDINYDESYKLFQKSKNWSINEINLEEEKIQQKINTARNDIVGVKDSYDRKNSAEYLKYVIKSGGTPGKLAMHKSNTREYNLGKKERAVIAKNKQTELLKKLENLMLRKSVLNKYRKPLAEKGCEKFLEDRESMCKEKLSEK